jgi:hypothetical protein
MDVHEAVKNENEPEAHIFRHQPYTKKAGFFEKPAFISSNDKRILDGLHAGRACL